MKVWSPDEMVRSADLNGNFAAVADGIPAQSYVTPTAIVGPMCNTNPAFPVRSRLAVQGAKTSTDQHSSDWMTVIGIYSETGGPTASDSTHTEDVGLYVGAMQGSGDGRNAGGMWTLNTDIVRGAIPGGPNSINGLPGSGMVGPANGVDVSVPTIGYELDLSNWDRDAGPGGAFVVGMFINTLSQYSSLAGIYYGNGAGEAAGTAPSWHNGILFQHNTCSDSTILDVSGAANGYHTAGVHSNAAFYDEGTGSQSLLLTGLKSIADIQIQTNSPAAITMSGTRSVAAIYDTSTGPRALLLAGNHDTAMVEVAGVSPAGFNASGTFSLAALTTGSATTNIALSAGPGQTVAFNGIANAIRYDPQSSKFLITNNTNQTIASLDDQGNLRVLGTVTASVTP